MEIFFLELINMVDIDQINKTLANNPKIYFSIAFFGFLTLYLLNLKTKWIYMKDGFVHCWLGDGPILPGKCYPLAVFLLATCWIFLVPIVGFIVILVLINKMKLPEKQK